MPLVTSHRAVSEWRRVSLSEFCIVRDLQLHHACSSGNTLFVSLILFPQLSLLQEPQTTVIHNPVDGIKVHPSPPPRPRSHPQRHLVTPCPVTAKLRNRDPQALVCSPVWCLSVPSVCLPSWPCVWMHVSDGEGVRWWTGCLVVSHCPSVFRLSRFQWFLLLAEQKPVSSLRPSPALSGLRVAAATVVVGAA